MRTTTDIVKPFFLVCCGKLSNLKNSFLILILFTIFNCSDNPETFIVHIDGYWEIEDVTFSDGTKKEYKFSETIDYINVNDSLQGFRKKLKPGINDTYFTSDNAEALTLKIEDGDLNMYYTTPYAQWKETVLEASAKHLKLKNADNNVYLYKRYTPINLDIK